MLCETQSVSSRIWTRVAVFISYDDNNYTTGTWRRIMKQWSMCWRKLVIISISGLFVLIWRWWTFSWDNSLASPSTHIFCACGIVGTVLSITRRRTGLCGRNCCLAKKGTSSTTLWWTETEYFSHCCTQARLNQAVHQGSGQGWWLLHLLVLGFSRIYHGEVESWHLGRSSDPAAHQRSSVRKLNERSRIGSVEGICFGSEEISWQQ